MTDCCSKAVVSFLIICICHYPVKHFKIVLGVPQVSKIRHFEAAGGFSRLFSFVDLFILNETWPHHTQV